MVPEILKHSKNLCIFYDPFERLKIIVLLCNICAAKLTNFDAAINNIVAIFHDYFYASNA